jgi:hypothetical protein
MTKTLERVRRSIAKGAGSIVLRQDLLKLGSSARIDASLSELTAQGRLVRLGKGVYAKTKLSSNSTRVPIGEFSELAIEALDRLGVEYELHPAIVDYRNGKSDQVPLRLVVRAKNRSQRKMSLGVNTLKYVSNFATTTSDD